MYVPSALVGLNKYICTAVHVQDLTWIAGHGFHVELVRKPNHPQRQHQISAELFLLSCTSSYKILWCCECCNLTEHSWNVKKKFNFLCMIHVRVRTCTYITYTIICSVDHVAWSLWKTTNKKWASAAAEAPGFGRVAPQTSAHVADVTRQETLPDDLLVQISYPVVLRTKSRRIHNMKHLMKCTMHWT